MSDDEQRDWSNVIAQPKNDGMMEFGVQNAVGAKVDNPLPAIGDPALKERVDKALGLQDIAGERQEKTLDVLLGPWDSAREAPLKGTFTPEGYPKKSFTERGKSLIENQPQLNQIIFGSGFNIRDYYTSYGNAWRFDYRQVPEEILALRSMLADGEYHQVGMDHETLDQSPRVILETIKVLRPQGWNERQGVSGGPIYENSAAKIISALKTNKAERGGALLPLTNEAFDMCVAACFSCGDINAGIELVKRSQELLGSNNDTRVAALRRTANILRNAYYYYDEPMRQRVDAVLAGQPEDFQKLYKDVILLGNFEDISTFLQNGDRRLTDRLRQHQREWYDKQQVVQLGKREEAVTEKGLASIIEAAAEQPDTIAVVKGAIEQRIDDYITGSLANNIAGELSRRMHPELRLAAMREVAIREAKGIRNATGGVYIGNEYSSLYGHGKEGDLSAAQRREVVDKLPEGTPFDHARKLYLPNEINFQYLIQLIKSPYSVVDEMQRSLVEQTRRDRSIDAQVLKRKYAAHVIPALSYLRLLTDDPTMKGVLTKEFGLGKYLGETNQGIEKTIELVTGFVGEDTLLELQKDEEMQDGLDAARVETIVTAIPSEKNKISRMAQTNAQHAATLQVHETDVDLRLLTDEKEDNDRKKEELERKKAELRDQLAALAAREEEIEAKPISRGFLGMGKYTQDQKSLELAPLQEEISVVKGDISQIDAQVGSLKVISQRDLDLLLARKQRLQELQTALAP